MPIEKYILREEPIEAVPWMGYNEDQVKQLLGDKFDKIEGDLLYVFNVEGHASMIYKIGTDCYIVKIADRIEIMDQRHFIYKYKRLDAPNFENKICGGC